MEAFTVRNENPSQVHVKRMVENSFFCFKMTKNDRSRCFEMFSCVYLTACVSFWFPSNTNKSFTSKNADELYESLKKKFKNKLHECKLSVIVQTV